MNGEWILHRPADMHMHLRQGPMLHAIARASCEHLSGAVIMPNLVPPVSDIDSLRRYREEINGILKDTSFKPLMTLFFRDYSENELAQARDEIIGIKLYPEGITTNSSSGVRDISDYQKTLRCMEEIGIPLLVHGESHGFVLDREREFLTTYSELAETYPRLMIVMEHITTADAVELLDRHENLHATVTLHHLLLTLDDMAGGLLNPHLFCKPILKRPEDREALQGAALSGHPRLMYGSDSAPHPVSKKECCGCAAGVFSAPVSLPLLADFFDRNGRREQLQSFVSGHAERCYKIDLPEKTVLLRKEQWVVPERIGEVVPFMAGKALNWKADIR